LVMKEGKLIEEGDVHQIFTNPQEVYTRDLLDAIPGKSLLGVG